MLHEILVRLEAMRIYKASIEITGLRNRACTARELLHVSRLVSRPKFERCAEWLKTGYPGFKTKPRDMYYAEYAIRSIQDFSNTSFRAHMMYIRTRVQPQNNTVMQAV